MSSLPRTARGSRTRAKILQVATEVFAARGFHDASIVKITEAADVGQGTFYLYFSSKQEIFEEVVKDLNSRVRQAMFEASSAETDRLAAERAGFRAFFRFTAENPALYRVIRQAEFVAPDVFRLHYERIAAGYVAGLRSAQQHGQLADVDPEVTAWALMGIGELVGMRWVLWPRGTGGTAAGAGAVPGPGTGPEPSAGVAPDGVPTHVFEAAMHLIERALSPTELEGRS
ncbi:TetR/AcrR family transcriptional regulator [Georgenia sp. SYP-B2076]|uniref:TetR/AcrR family transcriptional regulator n=1 Tax=Georgenia sp. SYP-B2076 TaxID=2495881 RepID=UPI000F8C95D5|nr:TetR/AcrR family transcriptional regulator [Georgenia sp. SYP-B2076]